MGHLAGANSMQLRPDWSVELGRDPGPYSTRNSSKGALLGETQSVFRALASGKSLAELHAECLTGGILRHRAQETRERVWDLLHWRFFAWRPPPWVLADLSASAGHEVTSPEFVGLVLLHYARRDRLTFDFATGKLWSLWKSGGREVLRNDVSDFLAEDASSPSGRWRETTRLKVAGNVLSALRDFGLLSGVQRKLIRQPSVPVNVALHLCRLLREEGLRGRSILEAADWHLFLWDQEDTTRALAQLAQRGNLRFERAGRSVVLEVLPHPLGDARWAL